jgi:hypothetical protein
MELVCLYTSLIRKQINCFVTQSHNYTVNLYKTFQFDKIKISIIKYLKVTAVNGKKTRSHILGYLGFSQSILELDNNATAAVATAALCVHAHVRRLACILYKVMR